MNEVRSRPDHAASTPQGEPSPLTLIHFGDLHLWRLGWDLDFTFKRALGLANLIARRGRRFPEPVAQLLVDRLSQEQADFLVFTGDLTTTALRREFLAGRQMLAPLLERWGNHFIAIPGNHDRYTARAVHGRLFESLFLDESREHPFAVDLDNHWTLVGFDCSVARHLTSRGRMHPERIERLSDLLDGQRRRGRNLMAIGHYPLVYPAGITPSWEHVLPERGLVLNTLTAKDVKLYLHGHVHVRWRLQTGSLTHLNCGSAGMIGSRVTRRPGYLKIQLEAGGLISVQAHWLPEAADGQPVGEWMAAELEPAPPTAI